MKILLLSHKFHPDIGGIESISEMFANYLLLQGHEVKIVTWTGELGSQGFPYEIIRVPKTTVLLRAFAWADVIFENNPSIRLSWPNIWFHKPRVVSLHTWMRRLDGSITQIDKLKRLWIKKADKVIACSQVIKDDSYADAIVIGNPYDSMLFQRDESIVKDKDFVFLGRLVSDKGVDLAIAGFRAMLLQLPPEEYSTLTIIGDGEEIQVLQKQTEQLDIADKVFFVGKKKGEELVALLNQHKYLLVPSRWKEPFGIVALEGMACGCLPIVADGGGLPEAVGNAGLIFERNNQQSLTEKMIQVKTVPKLYTEQIANIANQLQKHTIDFVGESYLKELILAVENKKK